MPFTGLALTTAPESLPPPLKGWDYTCGPPILAILQFSATLWTPFPPVHTAFSADEKPAVCTSHYGLSRAGRGYVNVHAPPSSVPTNQAREGTRAASSLTVTLLPL